MSTIASLFRMKLLVYPRPLRLVTKTISSRCSTTPQDNKISSENTKPGSRYDGQKKTIHLRLARQDDYQNVLDLSEGIYDGDDYIPLVFHDWLNTPNKLMFLAELHGKAVGLQVANIVSDGKIVLTQSLRVHPEYRGRGLSFEIISSVKDFLRQTYPKISKRHYVAFSSTEMFEIGLKLGNKTSGNFNFYTFDIKKQASLLRLVTSRCQMIEQTAQCLYPCDSNTAAAIISSSNALPSIALQKMMFRDMQPYEAIPANIKYLFKEDDQMFADINTQEFQEGKIPRSFSHGCLSPRVRSMFWTCTIYGDDIESFRAHVLRQLEAATARIDQDSFGFFLDVCSKISSCDERRVLEQELEELNQSLSEIYSGTKVVFEDVFYKDSTSKVLK